MTLRTITFDDSTHKVVPLEPTIDMTIKGNESKDNWDNNFPIDFDEWSGCKQAHYLANLCYKTMIAAAPEYQEPQNKFAMFKDNGGEWQVIQDIGKDE